MMAGGPAHAGARAWAVSSRRVGAPLAPAAGRQPAARRRRRRARSVPPPAAGGSPRRGETQAPGRPQQPRRAGSGSRRGRPRRPLPGESLANRHRRASRASWAVGAAREVRLWQSCFHLFQLRIPFEKGMHRCAPRPRLFRNSSPGQTRFSLSCFGCGLKSSVYFVTVLTLWRDRLGVALPSVPSSLESCVSPVTAIACPIGAPLRAPVRLLGPRRAHPRCHSLPS